MPFDATTVLSRDIASKAFTAGRDAALETAEKVTRDAAAGDAADALHSLRSATGTVQADELPIADYDDLNVSQAAAAISAWVAAGALNN